MPKKEAKHLKKKQRYWVTITEDYTQENEPGTWQIKLYDVTKYELDKILDLFAVPNRSFQVIVTNAYPNEVYKKEERYKSARQFLNATLNERFPKIQDLKDIFNEES